MFERDQAAGLRALFDRQRPEVLILLGNHGRQAKVCIELAQAYTRQDVSVLLLDGSAGSLGRSLGVTARYELSHVIAGDKRLSQVVHFPGANLALLPAHRGLGQLVDLEGAPARRLRGQFASWNWPVELLLVNARARSGARVLGAFAGRARVVVVVSGESESLTDAYREVKDLQSEAGIKACDVIVHGARATHDARQVFAALAGACRDFLGVQCSLREPAGRRHWSPTERPFDAAGVALWRQSGHDGDMGTLSGEVPYAAIG
jgi:flagellar biosynthesis protein FlhG